jgi:predicted RNA-binding Zn ribbon-like protein
MANFDVSGNIENSAYYIRIDVRSQLDMSTYRKKWSELVQDLINSYDLYLEEPEHLRKPKDLVHFLERHGIAIDRALTDGDLEDVRDFRTQVRALWTAAAHPFLVDALNQYLVQSPVMLELSTDTKNSLHLNFNISPTLRGIEELKAKSILGLVTVLEHYGLERMGACAADPCQDVYIDVSRNRSRRFCSERCANRYNIAAYRERNQG